MADSAERNADIVVAVRGNITLTTATGLANATITSYDEYGNTNTDTKTRPSNAWHGHQQRSTNSTTGLIQMGVRLYNSITGLFLQQDPVHGGNPNTYTHPVDPINKHDCSGKCGSRQSWESLGSVMAVLALIPGVDVVAGPAAVFIGADSLLDSVGQASRPGGTFLNETFRDDAAGSDMDLFDKWGARKWKTVWPAVSKHLGAAGVVMNRENLARPRLNRMLKECRHLFFGHHGPLAKGVPWSESKSNVGFLGSGR